MAKFKRGSGILLHPTSLPSKYGIGELGGSIFRFIDLLEETNQSYWQTLPLGPTGYGDSPYQSFSSFAGNPLLISIEELINEKLLMPTDIELQDFNSKSIEYGRIISYKDKILRKAFENFTTNNVLLNEFTAFKSKSAIWLDNYALFTALKNKFNLIPWYEWESGYQDPKSEVVTKFKANSNKEIEYINFVQFLFDKQWEKVKKYANSRNIRIIGDLPIFVAYDSADCWANQQLYLINKDGTLKYAAGVPPDYFSATGQFWGNPLYNWSVCKENGYGFWIRRLQRTLELVDIIRIDHFRGFEAYWQIPAEATTAIDGKWVKGPGNYFFKIIYEKLGDLPLIAEDLGIITEEVVNLRRTFGMPGMVIMQYGFSKNQDGANKYLAHNLEENSVVYSGTHDNDTTLGWYASASREIKDHFLKYTNSTGDDISGDMIKLVMSTICDIAIIPMQDLLRKKNSARMNFPGKAFGNWQWRFKFEELKNEWIYELINYVQIYNRI